MNLEKLTIGNAAGTVRTVEQVRKLSRSAVTRIKVGTMTRPRREGNTPIPGGRIYFFDHKSGGSLNALGMPNVGSDEFETIIGEMVRIAHEADKELWVSIAGESPGEFAELAAICFAHGVDGVELNLGCPNVHDKGVSKPIFSYHPDLVEEVLHPMLRFYGKGKHISVKISPVPDEVLPGLVRVINKSPVVTEVTATNTLPNQEMKDEYGHQALAYIPQSGTEVKHTGGLGGKLLMPHSLRVVRQLRNHSEKAKSALWSSVRLTVVGGIGSGADLMEYVRAAHGQIDGFEVGTDYYEHENVRIFSDIIVEMAGLLEAA